MKIQVALANGNTGACSLSTACQVGAVCSSPRLVGSELGGRHFLTADLQVYPSIPDGCPFVDYRLLGLCWHGVEGEVDQNHGHGPARFKASC